MKARMGNAEQAGAPYRGWFIGSFVRPEVPPLLSQVVEMKWVRHRKGEERSEWSASPLQTVAILIAGRFRFRFEDGETMLRREGDFVAWEPHVFHHWTAEEDSLIITLRWREDVRD